MKKRFHDCDIYDQSWFVDLPPEHKLVFHYIEKKCDNAGVWKIDVVQMKRDLNISAIDMNAFIDNMNQDYDPITGEEITRERLVRVGKGKLWLTGFIDFQFGKLQKSPLHKSAIKYLENENLLNHAVSKGLVRVGKGWQEYIKGSVTLAKGDGNGDGDGDGDGSSEDITILKPEDKLANKLKAIHEDHQTVTYPVKGGELKKLRLLANDFSDDQICQAWDYFVGNIHQFKTKKNGSLSIHWFYEKFGDIVQAMKEDIQHETGDKPLEF